MAHVRFHRRKWVKHTRLSEKDRTQRITRRNTGLPSLVHSVVLCCRRYPFYSTTLLYTYISRFSVNPQHQQKRIIRQSCHHKFYPQPLFNFSYNRPTFAFTSESGHTLGFRRRIAHKGLHGETGAFRTGPLSLPSTRTARSRTSPGRVSERQTLPLLDPGRGALEERRKPSEQRCAHARRCSEASRPRWAAHTYAVNTSIFPAEFFSHSQKAGKKSHSLMFHIHVFDCTA